MSIGGSDANPCTAAAPCLSFARAYQAAAAGSTICVAAGNYGAQTIPFVSGRTTPNVVFQGCNGGVTVLGLVVGADSGGTQPCCVTFKDMAITGSSSKQAVFIFWGSKPISTSAHDVTFDNVDFAVGKATKGAVIEAFDTLRLTIKNSRIGPACCGFDVGGGSPVGIRLGTADRVSLGWAPNTDAVIDNNTIKGITRLCSEWLSGYGPCPATTCPNANDLCHEDAIQVYGATNLTVTRNRIYHVGINGLFLDSTDPTNGGLIANNMIGDIMRGATCFDIDGRGIYGVWNVINNTCSIAGGDGFYVGNALVMDTHNAVWNWQGNVGAIFISAITTPEGSSGNCQAGSSGVFTYSYNTLSTDNSAATNCGGNTTVGNPTYVNTALAPADSMDLHLSGSAGAADNKIPSCFVASDIDGNSRPIDSNCDAGADER